MSCDCDCFVIMAATKKLKGVGAGAGAISVLGNCDEIVEGSFLYLNKFRGEGVESFLPQVEDKAKAKEIAAVEEEKKSMMSAKGSGSGEKGGEKGGEFVVVEEKKKREPLEMVQLRMGLFELAKKKRGRGGREKKKKDYEVPEHLKKAKKEVDVLADYDKYINVIGQNGVTADGRGWRALELEERKEKLDEYFIVTIAGVPIDESLKMKIYKLVSEGKMSTAKDVKYDKVNQRIVNLPLMMKFDEDLGRFVEPTVDRATQKRRNAIKKAKSFFK